MTDTPEDRRYTVVTTYDGQKLARKLWADRRRGFWTHDNPEDIWSMDRNTAEEIARRLVYNQPQVVRLEKAIGWIEAQRDAYLQKAAGRIAVETPAEEEPSPGM